MRFAKPSGLRPFSGSLQQEVERLRETKELQCSEEVALRLRQVSPKTIPSTADEELQR